MHQEHNEIKLALELVSGQFEFLEDSKASSSVVKNCLFKEQFGRDRCSNGLIVINGRDDVSFRESVP